MIQPQTPKEVVQPRGLMGPERTLSWSQIFLVRSNPRGYYKKYILGEKQFETKETIAGKNLHEKIENDEDIGTDTDLEKADKKEDWIETMFSHENGEVKLVGQMDGIKREGDVVTILERKTGKIPWFQEKVDTHGQLKMYAYILFLRDGILPKTAILEWIKTKEDDNGNIVVTGEIETFTKNFTEQDLEDAKEIILDAISRIEFLVKNYDAPNEAVLELMTIKAKMESLSAREALLRQQLQEEMISLNITKMVSPFATVSINEKKSYSLPPHQKAELKRLKEEFEKDLTPEVSEYMTVRFT